MGISELRRLKQLDEDYASLKKWVADLSLNKHMLQKVIKKFTNHLLKKTIAEWIVETYAVSKH